MKKILSLAVVILFVSSCVFAQSAKEPTGNDYLAMTKNVRAQTVSSLINDAKKGGVTIKQTPVSYCKRLDRLYEKHPDMKSKQLATVLKTLIIMEYDWDQKGVDKDQLARQYLGENLYQKNKARLSKKDQAK